MIDLFARNFDSDNAPAAPVTTIDEEELNLRLAEARKQGFDAGRAVGQQDAKAEFDAQEDARLEAESAEIRAQLDALIAQDTRQCRATETDIVELFLGIGDRLVPELLQNYGVDLAIGRIRESVALSRSTPVLSITACPEVAARLQARGHSGRARHLFRALHVATAAATVPARSCGRYPHERCRWRWDWHWDLICKPSTSNPSWHWDLICWDLIREPPTSNPSWHWDSICVPPTSNPS